jgi:hypothetical protein
MPVPNVATEWVTTMHSEGFGFRFFPASLFPQTSHIYWDLIVVYVSTSCSNIGIMSKINLKPSMSVHWEIRYVIWISKCTYYTHRTPATCFGHSCGHSQHLQSIIIVLRILIIIKRFYYSRNFTKSEPSTFFPEYYIILHNFAWM